MVYLNLEQIKINIDTGIYGKKENIVFTSKLLYHPTIKFENLSEYPFILSNMVYPKELIMNYLKNKDYNEKVKLFFNKSYSEKLLKRLIGPINDINKQNQRKEEEDIHYMFKVNIPFMLKLLFPTTFPAKNNVTTSFDEYIKNSNTGEISFTGFLYSNQYSYLRIDSKKYTVIKVIWLNDIINNELYKSVITTFNDYKNWSESTIPKLENKNILSFNSLLKKLGGEYTIKKYIELFEDNISEKSKESRETRYIAVDEKKTEFYDNIKTIMGEITKLYNKKKVIDDQIQNKNNNSPNFYKDSIKELFTIISTIKTIYSNLMGTSRTLKGIDNEFQKKVNKIFTDLEKCDNFNIIKNYLNVNNINKNFENEDEKIKTELKKNIKFINFVNKIKSTVTNKCSNSDLNDIVQNYYENIPDSVELPFNKLMDIVLQKYMDSKPNYGSINEENLNVGVNILNQQDLNASKYEMFIAVDLIEGEINDSNVNSIKCNYRDEKVTNYTKNVFENNNVFSFMHDRVFIPEVKKESEKKEMDANKKK